MKTQAETSAGTPGTAAPLASAALKLFGGRQRPGEPPVIRGAVPFLGSALPFGRDAPTFLATCQARSGDVFTILVAGQRMTFVLCAHSHPAILKLQGDLSFTELAHDIAARAFGHPRFEPGLANAIDEATFEHLKGRSLELLSERALQRLGAWLSAESEGGWRTTGLYDFVRRAMFMVSAESIFGPGWAEPQALEDFIHFDQRFPLLVAGVPARALPGVHTAQLRLAALVRATGARTPSDFLVARGRVMHGRMSEEEAGRTDLGLLWAAAANTLPAAFWTLAHLLHDREALQAVSAEVRARLGAEEVASPAALREVPLLQSAISEALRLSSASITLRRALRPTTITLESGERYAIRQGDLVCLFPYLMHHDAEIFAEPERFKYDRFHAPGGVPTFFKRGKRLTIPLMPYGGGVSMCPGRHLANTEIKQFVATLLARYDLEALAPAPPPLDRSRAGLGVMPPTEDVAFQLRRRAQT